MTKKVDITEMTMEQILAYAGLVKQKHRDNNARYYNNTIKTDPEKHEIWKQKCKVANQKQYNKKKHSPATEISLKKHLDFEIFQLNYFKK